MHNIRQTPPVVDKRNLVPFVLITSLFALWGFANDITNPMVSAFKKVLELDNFQASLVQMAFYGGYFTMALPAALFVKRYSYKTGILIGLGLYATGALLFWPAAAFESYPFFLAALYILTFGLAFLETTANPYILSLGDPKTATRRLNLAQSFNPMGALTGLFVAQTFILGSLQSDDLDAAGHSIYETLDASAKAAVRSADLAVIRDPYVALGVFVMVMFGVIFWLKMPDKSPDGSKLDLFPSLKKLARQPKYREGVLAQIFYVGAQIMCWTYIYQYAESLGIENRDAVTYAYWALGLFLTGRFVCTYLLKYVAPGRLLMWLAVAAMGCTAGAIFIEGMTGLYSLVGISFCMSLMFPTIYGIALDGLGEETEYGAAGLVMAIVGGALMPSLQGLILDIGGTGYTDTRIWGVPEVNFSFMLPFLCFLFIAVYGWRAASVHRKK
ncbi:MAG: L-fucose:H+ symporter permease [Bacteroidetes bacterium]|nr:MAG: L-fucose:H+ symporter permease [Bacteroidota bacterium]